jgi:hypothetical protein
MTQGLCLSPHPPQIMVGCNSVFLLYKRLGRGLYCVCVKTMFEFYLFFQHKHFKKRNAHCLRVFFGFGNVP